MRSKINRLYFRTDLEHIAHYTNIADISGLKRTSDKIKSCTYNHHIRTENINDANRKVLASAEMPVCSKLWPTR
jgi:hypothetical protein